MYKRPEYIFNFTIGSHCNKSYTVYVYYMLTILGSYLNLCETFKYKKEDLTTAMLMDIADKPFTMEDIIYFK